MIFTMRILKPCHELTPCIRPPLHSAWQPRTSSPYYWEPLHHAVILSKHIWLHRHGWKVETIAKRHLRVTRDVTYLRWKGRRNQRFFKQFIPVAQLQWLTTTHWSIGNAAFLPHFGSVPRMTLALVIFYQCLNGYMSFVFTHVWPWYHALFPPFAALVYTQFSLSMISRPRAYKRNCIRSQGVL